MGAHNETLVERIVAAATADRGIRFVDAAGEYASSTWSELHRDARIVAAELVERGVQPGSRVALLSATSPDLVTVIQAVWLCGATVVVLPLPMRLAGIEVFVEQTARRIEAADVAALLVSDDFLPFLDNNVRNVAPKIWSLQQLRDTANANVANDFELFIPAVNSLAVLQFTSGSTSLPKGVMLEHQTVVANIDALCEAGLVDPKTDRLVSWLPLYHDMGLIGILTTAMCRGVDLVLSSPTEFLRAPAQWMSWVATYGATLTAGPNFAYALAARGLQRGEKLDLSTLRLALNGAEPVDPSTVESFIAAGERHGLDSRAVFPAFGMAEVCIAGTFPEPWSGLRVDFIDRNILENERLAVSAPSDASYAKRFVMLGKPVRGLEIRVCDETSGNALFDREVGELQVRGTSVTSGYFRRPDANAEFFTADGWFRTGDLAYIVDGELVVCGRIKDLIILGGRNVYPEDVERAVGALEQVRTGNVIAFGVEGRKGKEALVVVAETRHEDPGLRAVVQSRVLETVGVAAEEVLLVGVGTLPKTSSGKLQRSRCRELWERAELT